MLLLSIVNYLNGMRTIENLLRDETQAGAARIARDTEDALRDRESNLVQLVRLPSLADFLRSREARGAATAQNNRGQRTGPDPSADETLDLPIDVRADVRAFFLNYKAYYAAITCVDAAGRPLFRTVNIISTPGGMDVRFETKGIEPSEARADPAVWMAGKRAPLLLLRSPVTREPFGPSVRYTVPIFTGENRDAPAGALVVKLKLNALFEEAQRNDAMLASPVTRENASLEPTSILVVLDRAGTIIYHTDDALIYNSIAGAMPFFKTVADKMADGAVGSDSYSGRDGSRWLAAYQPVGGIGLSVAVAGNYTSAVKQLQRAGLAGITLSLFTALLAAALLILLLKRTTRRIETVAEGAAAIAAGDLDQRIQVGTNDETRVLADSFNLMSDRLREHIAREAESRQFEAFTRLSAMLTHDLKNAITSLSMLVGNMERQFHRAEFRADAVASLREATDKLRGLVARLSEPVKNLSGEHERDLRAIDLVPVINRVLAATTRSSSALYEIETRMPAALIASVEPERIEGVIENLIINALEAMRTRGGRLTVEAGQASDTQIFFSIADTGVGMSEDFLRTRLFHAFATTKNRGIGLGLYTCREIVEAHGGFFEVESKPNIGTRFRVVLPSSASPSDQRATAEPQTVATR